MVTFFATADDFAACLEQHGATKTEFIVGYYKRASNQGISGTAAPIIESPCATQSC
jgi:hypothetical protein